MTIILVIAICVSLYVVYKLFKGKPYERKKGSGGSEPSGEKDNPNDQTEPRK